jgi:hydrogenase-4 component F
MHNLTVFIHSLLHLLAGIAVALPSTGLAESLGIDALSRSVFFISAILYFAVGLYSLRLKTELTPRQSSIYAICMMLFVASMDGASLSRDLGLIWVFVETTTLASAMLISFEKHKQSIEAAWKYLFICSIGIALAFVGILLLIIAQPHSPSLFLDRIISNAGSLNSFWLKISFVFILIGFGTKAGLAPMHFWLPDAHSEAPAPVSALLSGALLNTALLPLLRMQKVMNISHLGTLASQLFLILGFASMFIAAVFIMKITNYKRLLAYSSIENMGIILIAFALGDLAGKAGLIHIMGHSLIKSAFFLTAGNIYYLVGKKDYNACGGLLGLHPASGWLWLIAFMFIIGMPPSPLFFSELFIAFGFIKAGYILP